MHIAPHIAALMVLASATRSAHAAWASPAAALPPQGQTESVAAALPPQGQTESVAATLPPQGQTESVAAALPPQGQTESVVATLPPQGQSESPAVLGPARRRYKPGEPIPAGYTLLQRSRWELVYGGGLLFASSYVPNVLIGAGFLAFGEGAVGAPMFVPIAGPIISWAQGMSALKLEGFARDLLSVGTLVSSISNSIVQTGGVGLMIAGIFLKNQQLIRNDLLPVALGERVRLVPQVGRDGSGFLLIGSF